MKEDYRIKENSWLAKIAAKKLGKPNVAMVIGNIIHLHHISGSEFLANEKWVKHELCHIRQFRKYGTISFILMYLWESMLKGYYNNKYEVEAREAENS